MIVAPWKELEDQGEFICSKLNIGKTLKEAIEIENEEDRSERKRVVFVFQVCDLTEFFEAYLKFYRISTFLNVYLRA
jgi:hypothetical protein